MTPLPTDLQEMFNTAARGIHSQGYKSVISDHGRCAYRGREGRKCGVGWLLPDDRLPTVETLSKYDLWQSEHRKTDPNEMALDMIFQICPNEFSEWIPHQEFLGALQMAHDSACIIRTGPEYGKFDEVHDMLGIATNLRGVAFNYDLDASVIDELWGKENVEAM